MLFHTLPFAGFFAVVFAVYVVLTRRAQNVLLLAASYAFYAAWDWRFLSLLWISTIVDFTVARGMAVATPRGRRLRLVASLTTNLGILGFFKYCGFFVDSGAALLRDVGFEVHPATLSIVLPVGISFYTFQTLAYTIDVYRGRMRATTNLLDFALYVAYFPQLVAGPIERAQRLLPQLEAKRVVDAHALSSGALLFLIGLVRKIVVADGVAPFVDEAFADPTSQSSGALLVGAVLFGVQIYGDFAGYSDMARGISRMFGIELMSNFERPYFAANITDFWRRWHISLSTWLRDYLYIPLGGNRSGRIATYRNLMITMLLGGLWHGAAWTFVIWGGIHGLALSVHKALFRRRSNKNVQRPAGVLSGGGLLAFSWSTGSRLLTLGVVAIAWVFFRARDLDAAIEYLQGIVLWQGELRVFDYLDASVAVAACVALDLVQRLGRDSCAVLTWPAPLRGAFYAAAVLAIVLLRSRHDVPFIYFQF